MKRDLWTLKRYRNIDRAENEYVIFELIESREFSEGKTYMKAIVCR